MARTVKRRGASKLGGTVVVAFGSRPRIIGEAQAIRWRKVHGRDQADLVFAEFTARTPRQEREMLAAFQRAAASTRPTKVTIGRRVRYGWLDACCSNWSRWSVQFILQRSPQIPTWTWTRADGIG
jgi:hypothetical protein